MTMPKPYIRSKRESKSGTFNPSKRPPRGLSEKADRSTDSFRGRKDKSSEYFTPSGRTTRDLPEKADRSTGDIRGHREGKPFFSFDRPKREQGFVSGDKKPVTPEHPKTVSAAALKRGFERAKDEILGVCDEISSLMSSRHNVGTIELTVSFSSTGEFIGFGVGGAASIKITVTPSK
jgi:hypothetical protein